MTGGLRTIFMGTPDFAVPTLEMLARETDLQLVITQPDKRQGRGKKLVFSPVKTRALELGLTVIGPSVVKGKRFATTIAEYSPDVLVTAAFGRLLGRSLIEMPRYGCLNVHASLLPRYRGAAPINWAIINGETETGVSIMKTVEALDAGDVYAVRKVAIQQQTAGELTQVLSELGARTLLEVLKQIDSIVPSPQNDAEATFAPIMKKADGHLNWLKSARELECQVRGMHPWPGTHFVWEDKSVKVHSVERMDTAPPAGVECGTVLAHTLDGIDVACGEGTLRLTSLQMPGKKRLDARQFFAGTKLSVGTRFQ